MNVQLISVIMIVFLGSIGIIIHGLIVLLQKNDRDILVGKLNARLAVYNNDIVPQLNSSKIIIDGYSGIPMKLEAEPLAIDGDAAGVVPEKPMSYVWRQTLTRRHVFGGSISGGGASTTVTAGEATSSNYKFELPYTKLVSRSIFETKCEKSFALDTCGVNPCCAPARLNKLCEFIAKSDNVNYTSYGGADQCLVTHVCGKCEWAGYIRQRCEILQWSAATATTPGGYKLAPQDNNHTTGCRYPFTSSDHFLIKDRPDDLKLSFRQMSDPYLWLQNETYGTMRLGVSGKEQRKSALVMIGAGSAVLLIATGGAIAHTLNKKKIEKLEAERAEKKKKQMEHIQKKLKLQEEEAAAAAAEAGLMGNPTTDGSLQEVGGRGNPLGAPLLGDGTPVVGAGGIGGAIGGADTGAPKGPVLPPPPPGAPPRRGGGGGYGLAAMQAQGGNRGHQYVDMGKKGGGRSGVNHVRAGSSGATPHSSSLIGRVGGHSSSQLSNASSIANMSAYAGSNNRSTVASRTGSMGSTFSQAGNASPLASLPYAGRGRKQ